MIYQLFPLYMVRKGKINFSFQELKYVINNEFYLSVFYGVLLAIILLIIMFDCMRYLSKNRDSFMTAISAAISFTFILMICYLLFLAQTLVFFKGLSIEPKNVKLFRHDVATQAN